MGYLTNFIVYTLAMVGVIMLAVFVFKTTTSVNTKNGSKYLKIQDTLSLGPRKTLYIVSAGEEKFLIAGDLDRTTLISKLDATHREIAIDSSIKKNVEEKFESTQNIKNTSFQGMLNNISTKSSYMDKSNIGIYKTQNKPYDSVIKNLAERIRQ